MAGSTIGSPFGQGDEVTTVSLVSKLDRLSEAAAHDLVADGVLMSVFHDHKFFSLGAYPALGPSLNNREHDAEDTVCMHTVNRGAALQIEDARNDPGLRDVKYVRDGLIVGYLGIPIVSPQFGKIGSICSVTRTPRKWQKLELNYLQQVANNAELLLLQEMGRLELNAFSDSLSDMDRIVATLSSNTTSPISIYEQDGSLVFANAALLDKVPEKIIAGFWDVDEKQLLSQGFHRENSSNDLTLGERKLTIDTISGQKLLLKISCIASRSDLIVCIWHDALSIV